MTVQDQLRALIHKHHQNFNDQITTVGQLLAARDEHGGVLLANIVKAQGLTHQMKGTAGSMGFAGLSAGAADLDDSLKRLKSAGEPLEPQSLQEATALLEALRELAGQTTPEMSTLYDADLSQLTK